MHTCITTCANESVCTHWICAFACTLYTRCRCCQLSESSWQQQLRCNQHSTFLSLIPFCLAPPLSGQSLDPCSSVPHVESVTAKRRGEREKARTSAELSSAACDLICCSYQIAGAMYEYGQQKHSVPACFSRRGEAEQNRQVNSQSKRVADLPASIASHHQFPSRVSAS